MNTFHELWTDVITSEDAMKHINEERKELLKFLNEDEPHNLEELDINNYQGNAVVNYTEKEVPYTRVIEHKHFEIGKKLGNEETKDFESYGHTIISKEYSDKWDSSKEPYYPINNEKNNKIYLKYKMLADNDKNMIFGGRLGEYKYYDMDKIIKKHLKLQAKN